MSEFLKTIGALHVLDKIGSQDNIISDQNDALNRKSEQVRKAQYDADMADIGAEFHKKEAEKYKKLLAKPMHIIAEESGAFREAYEKQQEMLASWVVSQRAFKELAMKYGKLAGKTPEEINAEGMAGKEAILEDKSEFGNTVSESEKYWVKHKQAKEESKAHPAA